MKNRMLKMVLLSTCTVVVASASYGLIQNDLLDEKRTLDQEQLISSRISQFTQHQPSSQVLDSIGEELEHTVQSGENLSSIFSAMELEAVDLHKIVHANQMGKQFSNVEPGQNIVVTVNANGELKQLTYAKNPFETLIATRQKNGFDVKLLSKKIDYQINTAQVTIHSSLFEDAMKAGLSEKLTLKLADIFAWDIDFALSLRDDDQFTLIYEILFVDGKEFDTGEILCAEFINQGKTYTAVRFEDNQGHSGYYTPDGHALRKAFLQTPIDFAKISSHFSLHRKHPILNTLRAHKGVDYTASIGTPVKATGDGKVSLRGVKSGYGNVVEIQHGSKYSTLYAHLSGFRNGLKEGHSIRQGDIIGYVGKTGLATGPHLHYEFRINGEHINPLSAKLPRSIPMDSTLLNKFKAQTQPLIAQLQQAKGAPMVAQN